ncbi:unnamed protein product [Adineta ricciae]|uniref:Tetratricopeptide repeat protein n=1 Tax=Adineta ricciae TaxID=249248 RepID=A0A816ES32_ADIRI|nr:unnamed protein product [Adineta ricciae]CAF1653593.1 unnamed protein product [Adineta ricciae]
MSFGILVHTAKNGVEINSAHSLKRDMMTLESELGFSTLESSYIRVINWNMPPNIEDLQPHFKKFSLLQLEEKRLTSGKLNIIEKDESTYERFLYADFPEQQSTVTIFVKVNFLNKGGLFSLEKLIKKFNTISKKYNLIEQEGIDTQASIHPDSSNSSYAYIIWAGIIPVLLLLLIIRKVILPRLISLYSEHKRNQCLRKLQEYKDKLANQKQSYPYNHRDVAVTLNSIGNMYYDMYNYPDALSSYNEALEIQKKLHPPNYPDLILILNNIDRVYQRMNNSTQTISFYEYAIRILEQSPESYCLSLEKFKKKLESAKKEQ